MMWNAVFLTLAIAGAAPAETQTAPQSCVMDTAERAWLDEALGASNYMLEQRLRITPVARPLIIVFDQRCRFEMKPGDRDWVAEPHTGRIRLPGGGAFPAGLVAMQDSQPESGPYLLMALPSLWRAAKVLKGDETGPTAVFLHEFAHARQTLPLQPLFDAAETQYNPPDYFNDDSLQERFKDDPAYLAVWEKESDLLYRAAAEPDEVKARALARQALVLMEARQQRWFTGPDAMWKVYDDLYLTMEGFGQWIAYAWLADPKGGAMAATAARDRMRGARRQWSQEEGLGLFLVIDRFVPDWVARSFAQQPALGIDLLRRAAGQPAIPDERNAFAFLAGTWRLEARIDHETGTRETGSDTYEFRQPIKGGAIEARWRFNRGSETAPDWADALYVSGYHDNTRTWSFYYVSEKSAQHWTGRKEGGVWYFYFPEPFQYKGRTAIQRQWWESAGPGRVHRHFENSYDEGRTWTRVVTATLVTK